MTGPWAFQSHPEPPFKEVGLSPLKSHLCRTPSSQLAELCPRTCSLIVSLCCNKGLWCNKGLMSPWEQGRVRRGWWHVNASAHWQPAITSARGEQTGGPPHPSPHDEILKPLIATASCGPCWSSICYKPRNLRSRRELHSRFIFFFFPPPLHHPPITPPSLSLST